MSVGVNLHDHSYHGVSRTRRTIKLRLQLQAVPLSGQASLVESLAPPTTSKKGIDDFDDDWYELSNGFTISRICYLVERADSDVPTTSDVSPFIVCRQRLLLCRSILEQ